MPDEDLSLVSSDAMIEELGRRYDGMLLVRETFRTADSCDTMFDYAGGISRCIGMAERAKRRLLKLAEADPVGEDED